MPEYIPTKLEVSKLGVTLPLHYATDFIEWYKQCVTLEKGTPDANSRTKGSHYEASGSIEYLDPSCTKTLYEVSLMGVTPENFTITKTEGSSSNFKMCKFDLYCTQIKVSRAGFRG